MGAERYEIVIVSPKTGRQTKREWSPSELVKGVPWLKRMNAQGGDITLRPLDGPELWLADSLDAEELNEMHSQGLSPAVTVETSPGRFQAWVKLSAHPLRDEVRRHAVSDLAHFRTSVGKHGRLAGFTNRLVEPDRTDRQPYVLAHRATGMIAPAANAYLVAIERQLGESASEKCQQAEANRARRSPRL